MFTVDGIWYMDTDDQCYRVGKVKPTKDKKTGRTENRLYPSYYYNTFEGALECLYRLLEKNEVGKANSLNEAIKAVKTAREAFRTALSERIAK